jgi:hypothetical protein
MAAQEEDSPQGSGGSTVSAPLFSENQYEWGMFSLVKRQIKKRKNENT